jgi:hypothetical protein
LRSAGGRWLAFVKNRRGRAEVVVAPLIREGPRLRLGERRVPISNGGGIDPSWRKDGRELLYLTPDRSVTAVSITAAGDAFSIGPPVALFPGTDGCRRVGHELGGRREPLVLRRRRHSSRCRSNLYAAHELAMKCGLVQPSSSRVGSTMRIFG